MAIMSPGFTFRNDRKAAEFRDWLPFKESGTNVRTVLVSAEKTE